MRVRSRRRNSLHAAPGERDIAFTGKLRGIHVQPSSTYSRWVLHKLPRWLKRATGLDKRLAREDIAEITRMLRASRAAEEDARPRIVHMSDAVQVRL